MRLIAVSLILLAMIVPVDARRGGFLAALLARGAISAARLPPSSPSTTPSTVPPLIGGVIKMYGPDTLTADQLSACVKTAQSLDDSSERLEIFFNQVDEEGKQIQRQQSAVHGERAFVDQFSSTSVDAYNGKLRALNARIDAYEAKGRQYKQREAEHNAVVDSFNGGCATKRYYADDLAPELRFKWRVDTEK
jgi:hypothetical protein